MDRDELIQAVIDALTTDDESDQHNWTTAELSRQLDWTVEKTRSALIALKDDGKLGVTRKVVVNLSGTITKIPAYYLIANENQQEKNNQ